MDRTLYTTQLHFAMYEVLREHTNWLEEDVISYLNISDGHEGQE